MDWDSITTNVIIGLIGGSASWAITTITKLRRDIDSAFRKLRALEECNDQRNDQDRNGDSTKAGD